MFNRLNALNMSIYVKHPLETDFKGIGALQEEFWRFRMQ